MPNSSTRRDLTYSPKELADLVGRTVQTVRHHIKIGALAADKIKGARVRIKVTAATRWAATYLGKDIGSDDSTSVRKVSEPLQDLSLHEWL